MDFISKIDGEVATLFADQPILDLTDIPTARQTLAALLAAASGGARPSPAVLRTDIRIPGMDGEPEVLVRHYRPAVQGDPLPGVLWLHSGGHVLGDMAQDDLLMEHFVDEVGCAAVSVEWRRSPENPFPAALHDAYAALAWMHDNAESLGMDRERIAVAGSSSGGGLAAGLVLLARDRGTYAVAFQLLVYPMLDDRNVTPSSHLVTDPRLWNRGSNLIAWRAYAGAAVGTDSISAYAAPARATDLSGLPCTYIQVGTLDLFLDEDIDYAQRLLQAGVPTELHVFPGAVHGFDLFAPDTAIARRFSRERDDALRRGLGLAGTTV